jgi:hypothetical protein
MVVCMAGFFLIALYLHAVKSERRKPVAIQNMDADSFVFFGERQIFSIQGSIALPCALLLAQGTGLPRGFVSRFWTSKRYDAHSFINMLWWLFSRNRKICVKGWAVCPSCLRLRKTGILLSA